MTCFRASTKSMLCHRKPACRLSMETSICYKMAFPGSSAWKCSFYGRKLIEEAAFSRSSNRQSRSCGLLMKGPKPFHTFPEFVGKLRSFLVFAPGMTNFLAIRPPAVSGISAVRQRESGQFICSLLRFSSRARASSAIAPPVTVNTAVPMPPVEGSSTPEV